MKEELLTKKEYKDLIEIFESNYCQLESQFSLEQMTHLVKRASHRIFAQDNKGKIIAFARSMDDDCYQANIDMIVVHKDYQSKGLGTQILTSLMEEIKHIPVINIHANEPRLLEFFEKNGFEEKGISKHLQLVDYNRAYRTEEQQQKLEEILQGGTLTIE